LTTNFVFSIHELFIRLQLVIIISCTLLHARQVVTQLAEALPIADGVTGTFY